MQSFHGLRLLAAVNVPRNTVSQSCTMIWWIDLASQEANADNPINDRKQCLHAAKAATSESVCVNQVVTSPSPLDKCDTSRSLFLAGSIEQGTADDWQTELCDSLSIPNLLVLNPRRDRWDASWEQSIHNPVFKQQVDWELNAQQVATMIAMYFAPTTKAPITLLELGLFASSGKVIVCCPTDYWRRGNVEIVCDRFRIPLIDAYSDFAGAIEAHWNKVVETQ